MEKKADEVSLQETTYNPKSDEFSKLEEPKKPKVWFLYLAAFTADLTIFIAGTTMSWTSPVLPKLNGKVDPENNPLGRAITPSEESLLVSLLPLAATFGPFMAGLLSDKLGRKRALLIITVPMVISLVMSAFAQTIHLLCIARFIMGFGLGGVFVVLPIYLNEISESYNRGAIVGTMSISLQSGVLFSLLIGPYLSIKIFSLIRLLPLLIFVPVFAICFPETPHFLASRTHLKDLEKSLIMLRKKTKDQIQEETANIRRQLEKFGQARGSFKDMFKAQSTRKAYVIVMVLIMLQQCSGVSVIISYLQSILDAAKTGLRADICALLAGVIQIFATIISSILVDRLGRKILFITSCLGSASGLFGLGLCFYLKDKNFDVSAFAWLPTASVVIFLLLFNIGLRPLPWTILAETFPQHLKSFASTSATVICFFVAFVATVSFSPLSLVLGVGQCFWIFSLVCFSGSIFAYFILPETKGKSLQEIQKLLTKK